MTTVTMRELKQNPHSVVAKVLADGAPVEVTAHGRPTGVVLGAARVLANEASEPNDDLVKRINQAHALLDSSDGEGSFSGFAVRSLASRLADKW